MRPLQRHRTEETTVYEPLFNPVHVWMGWLDKNNRRMTADQLKL
jgi:hypothetical protein